MISITFKGEANPDDCPPSWYVGFREGYVIGYFGAPIESGKYGSNWGSGGGIDGYYGNGFAEGRLSGYSQSKFGDDKDLPEWFKDEVVKYFDIC